jgi:hypothetical protein
MKKYERDIPERPTRSGKENHDVQCDGIAGRRRTACTREASRLMRRHIGAHWNPLWDKYEVPMHTINLGWLG